MEVWRFLDTGWGPGRFNMALDEAIARSVSEGRSPPTLRVYAWKPYAISLGYHQKADIIDQGKCRQRGIHVVRRPTGGRAVLHAQELTYAVIIPSHHPLYRSNVIQSYHLLVQALVQALRYLGVEVDLASTEHNPHTPYNLSPACFTSFARYEILWHGRKLVGSAQKRLPGGLLQHGSILMGPYHQRLVELLRLPSGPENRFKAEMTQRTTHLAEILGEEVPWNRVAQALKAGFEQSFGIKFVNQEPTPFERELARNLETQFAIVD